jgi:hypothetical protein
MSNEGDTAVEGWIRARRAEGVELDLVGKGLRLRPADAYKRLSGDALVFLRDNRQAIKARVRELQETGIRPAVNSAPPVATKPAPRAVGPRPEIPVHIRRILEWDTPAERKRRDAEATKVMMR